MKRRLALLPAEYPPGAERPRTRADCEDGPRPCGWVSCRHHLYLDVSGGRVTHPRKEVDELAETCALDLADRGGATLEAVGAILGLTRERIRQLEYKAIARLQTGGRGDLLREMRDAGGFEPDTREFASDGSGGGTSIDHFGEEPAEQEEEDRFLDRVWRAYLDRSAARPHPFEGLIKRRPWEEPGITAAEASFRRRAVVIAAYRELAASLGKRPNIGDVARRARLSGAGAAASALLVLRLAKGDGEDLPFFFATLRGPKSFLQRRRAERPEPTTKEEAMKKVDEDARQRIHDAYCRRAQAEGRRPSPSHVLIDAGVSGHSNPTQCVRDAMRPWIERGEVPPFWNEAARPGTKKRVPPPATAGGGAKDEVIAPEAPSGLAPILDGFAEAERVARVFELVALALVSLAPRARRRVLQAALVFCSAAAAVDGEA